VISDAGDYFAKGCGRCPRFATPDCSVRAWAAGLAALRDLLRSAGLEEVVRWGHPCYRHAGRNIAILGAHRSDVRLSFFNAALLSDPAQVLERQGPNTAHPDTIRLSDPARLDALAPVIRRYLAEAMDHAAAGRVPPKAPRDTPLPEELAAALDADPALAAAFHALTPGRRRSHAILIAGAKAPETRRARVRKALPKILAGKGATER